MGGGGLGLGSTLGGVVVVGGRVCKVKCSVGVITPRFLLFNYRLSGNAHPGVVRLPSNFALNMMCVALVVGGEGQTDHFLTLQIQRHLLDGSFCR